MPADPATLQTAVMGVDRLGHTVGGRDHGRHGPGVVGRDPPSDVTVGDRCLRRSSRPSRPPIRPESPSAQSSFAYIIDYGDAGTLVIRTTGAAGDPAYTTNAAVVTLMAATLDVHAAGLTPGHTAATIGRNHRRPTARAWRCPRGRPGSWEPSAGPARSRG